MGSRLSLSESLSWISFSELADCGGRRAEQKIEIALYPLSAVYPKVSSVILNFLRKPQNKSLWFVVFYGIGLKKECFCKNDIYLRFYNGFDL